MIVRKTLVLGIGLVTLGAFVGLAELMPRYAVAAPSASASPSSTPSPSTSAASPPQPAKKTLASYSWPTDASPKPKDEEWAKATQLESVVILVWKRFVAPYNVTCEPSVVREWLTMKCTPERTFFGVAWGVAGDLKDVNAWFKMRGELGPPQYPDSSYEKEQLSMGAYATVTLPVRPGSATVLAIDQIDWVQEGYGSVVDSTPSFLVDVSWAAGEKSPTVAVR